MNKLLITSIALIISWAINAQNYFPQKLQNQHEAEDEAGVFFAGGAISYWNDTKAKSVTFDFCPEFGYLFNDDWGIGLLLGYEYEKETALQTTNAFKVSPFVRYYYYHQLPFNLYVDGGIGYNFAKNQKGNISSSTQGFEIGIRPGACVDLTEGLCLCLRMGFIGYRNDYFMGEEPEMGKNGFGIRFAPEELMIGLELEF